MSRSSAPEREQNLAVIRELATYTYPKRPKRQADLVMKGGITSGVVYPLAVCQLAKTYAFRSIGGSSAGGIAAALAATAEHARGNNGFQRLAGLPEKIGNDLPRLFQPSRGTRPLFEVFRSLQDKGHAGPIRVVRFLWYLISRRPGGSALGAGLVATCGVWAIMLGRGAPHDLGDWDAIVVRLWPLAPIILIGALLGAAVGTVVAADRELPRNGHGLCIGSNGSKPASGVQPFTDWMHDAIQHVADSSGVLTFGDLWGTTARNEYGKANRKSQEARDRALHALKPRVRLEMMTTNITQRRPMRLPFTDDRFMFCPEELGRWFPPDVLQHMCDKGKPAIRDDGTARSCVEHPDCRLRKLPDAHEFPVVVAVRMTLSFPGLISAVPLWTVDYGTPGHPLVRCWFSDGGISSNFPIHFFDSLLPSKPTFAISLGPYPPPPKHNEHVYYQSESRPPTSRPSDRLMQFLGGILDTMQNWSDTGQSMLPGYRDRIVELRQRPHEGGMNLNMDSDTILGLAVRGRDAAVALRQGFDFESHRRDRVRTALSELQQAIDKIGEFYDARLPSGDPSYQEFIKQMKPTAGARLDRLLAFAGRDAPGYPYPRQTPDFRREAPRPKPDLRIVARY